MAAEALLAANPDPTREDVVRAISGNVCRCTGYESIINAILDAPAEARMSDRRTTSTSIGTRPSSASDALGHVTGRTQYFEDVNPTGLLHLKMHRSERHHALLDRRRHVGRAEAVQGVVRCSRTRTCRTTGTRSSS